MFMFEVGKASILKTSSSRNGLVLDTISLFQNIKITSKLNLLSISYIKSMGVENQWEKRF